MSFSRRPTYTPEEQAAFLSEGGTIDSPEKKEETQIVESKHPLTLEKISHAIETRKFEFEKVLPKAISVDRFISTTLNAIAMNKELLLADFTSLLQSAMKAAQDGLLCDSREAALVIFNVTEEFQPDPTKSYKQARTIKKVQYMPMVKGLLKVIYSTGLVSSVSAHEVYENDKFSYFFGDEEKIIHEPSRSERGKIVAAYAIFRMKDGAVYREVIEANDLEKIRNVSRAKSGPWNSWAGEMSRKCAVRRGIKYLPTSLELDRLIEHDNELYDLKSTPNGDVTTPYNSATQLDRLLDRNPVLPITNQAKEKASV